MMSSDDFVFSQLLTDFRNQISEIFLDTASELKLLRAARLLAVPEGTVKSRLFLARQRLKELLQ